MNKHTPLYDQHVALDAKFCPFAGYDMPINYPLGVLKEHEWTRSHAGLFDVSHMGQAVMSGDGATAYLSKLTPTDFSRVPHGIAKYTVLTNQRGGIVDDLIITKLSDDVFFAVYNAARKEEDEAWIQAGLPNGVTFKVLEDRALIALQGPDAERVLSVEMPDAELEQLGYMRLMPAKWHDHDIYISRLGYTGEDGFEISLPASAAAAFWTQLLDSETVEPVGLGARDSLRLEMGYPLYGHDLDETTTPIEAGLSWVVSKEHEKFNGAEVILAQRNNGVTRKRVGIRLTGQGIAREGASIYIKDKRVGALTSGGFSPSLKSAIGQGYIDAEFATVDQEVEVEVRGRRIAAVVHELSFIPAKTKQHKKG